MNGRSVEVGVKRNVLSTPIDPDAPPVFGLLVDSRVISLESSSFPPAPSFSTTSSYTQSQFSMTVHHKSHTDTNSGAVMESVDFYGPSCRASMSTSHPLLERTPLSSTDAPSLAVCRTGYSRPHRARLGLTHPISKSHTRRCREKISRGFDTLLSILPDPAPGRKIKHKAQILEQALYVFRKLLQQRTCLQANLVLTSTATLASWTSSTLTMCALKTCVNEANFHKSRSSHKREHIITPKGLSALAKLSDINIGMVLEQFIGLYCISHGWPYAEVWLVQHQHNTPPILSLSGCVYNVEDHDLAQRLERYTEESRMSLLNQGPAFSGGALHRVSVSGAPEWLTDFGTADEENDITSCPAPTSSPTHGSQACIPDDWSAIARKWGLRTALVIPSMELSRKKITQGNESPCDAVVFLGDLESRLFNLAELEKLTGHLGVIHEEYKRFTGALDST